MKPLLIAAALILTTAAAPAMAGGFPVGGVAMTFTFPDTPQQPVTKTVTVLKP
ncbi:hypothetical protein [Ruegeria hyattellae]|uniref:hypothetical protein n=1 Tax=Ruegeria hyattellae TaxID=3233337 RepID=UPI00355BD2C7